TSTTTTTTKPATTTTTKSTAQQLTPAQRAAFAKLRQQTLQAAQRVVGLVDQGNVGQVWDEASNVAKQSVTRDVFVKEVGADRAKFGKLVSRKLAFINGNTSKGGQLPAGNYINVHYATQFANTKQPQRELVSFHLDNDKVWRLSGYTLNPSVAPQSAAKPH
ncbi:MAG: DUF4019 domain-containing protein, partial [Rhodanobacteraceae bacterium]